MAAVGMGISKSVKLLGVAGLNTGLLVYPFSQAFLKRELAWHQRPRRQKSALL
jgi:hypothetical protein